MITDDPAPWLLYACPCGCGLLLTADEYRAMLHLIRGPSSTDTRSL